MQQTFPAGTVQRVVITGVHGNLSIYGWEQQTVHVQSSDDHVVMQPEGDTLTITSGKDALELRVPFETIVLASKIDGDVRIEQVRLSELRTINGDIGVKKMNGTLLLAKVNGDVAINEVDGEVTLANIHGNLAVGSAPVVQLRGDMQGDVALLHIGRVEIEHTSSDLILTEVTEAVIGNVGSDLTVRGGIALLNCGNVSSNCHIEGDGNAQIVLANVGCDCMIHGVASLEMHSIGSDCHIQGNAQCKVTIGNIGSDLHIIGASDVQIGNIGSDCELRDVQGQVRLGHIGSDIKLLGVGGDIHMGHVGSDATIKGLRGSIQGGIIGSDLSLQADFLPSTTTRLQVGSDAHIVLPEHPNLTIQASVGGAIKGYAVAASARGNVLNLVYGDGSALLALQVGGELTLQGKESPVSSSVSSGGNWEQGDWSEFGREMSQWGRDFGREMAQWGSELGREISTAVQEALTTFSMDFSHKDHAGQAERIAKSQARRAQRLVKAQTYRAQRLAEAQRRRAERQVRRAGEHMMQSNMRHQTATNREQERETILRMIVEGRITPEEGDLLLGALDE